MRLSELVLDPSATPGPGCSSPQVVQRMDDMVGGKIVSVTADDKGLIVTVQRPEEPGDASGG